MIYSNDNGVVSKFLQQIKCIFSKNREGLCSFPDNKNDGHHN